MRLLIEETVARILRDDLSGLHCKKLKDSKNKFRVRIGRVRIIFQRDGHESAILDVGYRDDNTYQDY